MMNIMLGTCDRRCARISKTQCKANRHRGVFACVKCPGLVDVQAVVYETPAPAAPVALPQPFEPRPLLPFPMAERPRHAAIPAQRRSIYEPSPAVAAQILLRVNELMSQRKMQRSRGQRHAHSTRK